MKSGVNNFSYFPYNQLTKLSYVVQFKRVSVLSARLGLKHEIAELCGKLNLVQPIL